METEMKNNEQDIYASRSFDDVGEALCNDPEADASDAIALHLASQPDPVKAMADFCREAARSVGQTAR